MRKIWFVFPSFLLLYAFAISGQEQQPIQDLNQLVGKRVVIHRTPLCKPGTYTAVLDYAGKTATVISLEPSTTPALSNAVMDKLPPTARTMMEDAQRSATILFGFEDGTRLDSCAPVGPSRLSNYLELAPGQTLQPLPQGAAVSAPSLPGASTSTADLLSAGEVRQALSGSGKNHWVSVEDMGLMAAQGNQVPSIKPTPKAAEEHSSVAPDSEILVEILRTVRALQQDARFRASVDSASMKEPGELTRVELRTFLATLAAEFNKRNHDPSGLAVQEVPGGLRVTLGGTKLTVSPDVARTFLNNINVRESLMAEFIQPVAYDSANTPA